MADVFNLDQVSREAAAKRQPVPFVFRGREWTLRNLYTSVDLDTIEAAQEGTISAMRKALTAGLGEQAEEFQPGTLTILELQPLFEHWSEASGSEPGEPAASSDSSASTGRPSSPTSDASTASASSTRFTVDLPTGTPPANFSA